MDGKFHIRQVGPALVAGELMRGGYFYGFDVLEFEGSDIRCLPLRERRPLLDALDVLRPSEGSGGEFLEAVIESGGEGVVIKNLSQPWGARWIKCKRSQVFYCRVAKLDPWTGGAHLTDSVTGEPRGMVPIRGTKANLVRVGSELKIEAYGLTRKGLLREARLDKDTPMSWLVNF